MSTFTMIHVAISLVGIFSGFVVVGGLLRSLPLPSWTLLFLTSTVATSVTGFLLPFHKVTPAHAVGVISIVVLAIALVALYGRHLAGAWRWVYVVGAVVSLYLNVFVLVAQLFQKVPALKAIAPTQAEPPFLVAQGLTLVVFVVLGVRSVQRFHSGSMQPV